MIDILGEDEIAEICTRLKSMANEKRLSILFLLMDGKERTVNDIAEETGMAQPTASEHLKMMKEEAGFLVSRKEGKQVFYSTDNARIFGFVDRIRNHLADCCPE